MAGESPTHVVIGGERERESGRKKRKRGCRMKNYPRIPGLRP